MIAATTVEDALRAWVSGASGVSVVWAGQAKAPRVQKPFVTMRLTGLGRPGLDWTRVDATDPDAPTYRIDGPRVLTLTLTAFVDDATGSGAAIMILDRVLTALAFPAVHDALAAARVGPVPTSPIRTTDGLVNSIQFEPRAYTDVTVHAVSGAVVVGNYIETVEVEDLDRGTSTIVELP